MKLEVQYRTDIERFDMRLSFTVIYSLIIE